MAEIHYPEILDLILRSGAALVASISAGKDGQAMLNRLVIERYRRGWTGPLYALHCDLGRMEWKYSLPHCHRISYNAGVELVVRRRPQGDLLQQIQERMAKLTGTDRPFWPSPSCRYCTSDHKRDQADKELRLHKLVVSAEGIRADESDTRAKKMPLSIRSRITAKALKGLSIEEAFRVREPGQRLGLTWYPVFDWTEAEVYEACGHSIAERNERRKLYADGYHDEALADWWMHPAYVFGNDRVSCAICIVYGSPNDLEVGCRHNPGLAGELIKLEELSGMTFRSDLALKELV